MHQVIVMPVHSAAMRTSSLLLVRIVVPLLSVVACQPATTPPVTPAPLPASEFGLYLLSMTWEPNQCCTEPWPAGLFANLGGGDYGGAWTERREIYDLVRDAKITGFAIVSGDLPQLLGRYASAELPPVRAWGSRLCSHFHALRPA
jgi:hypothetical protein